MFNFGGKNELGFYQNQNDWTYASLAMRTGSSNNGCNEAVVVLSLATRRNSAEHLRWHFEHERCR